MKENFFIVIEGMDNSGKSTLIQSLKPKLAKSKKIQDYFHSKIAFTSEPYGPEERELKYEELSKPLFTSRYHLHLEASTLLFLAIRAEHLQTFILPRINQNFLIICDRFYPSTLVYQVYLKGAELAWVTANMQYLLKGLKPRLIFLLEVSQKSYTSFYLDKRGRGKCNKYDFEPSSSYLKLREAYQWAVDELKKEGIKVIIIPEKMSLAEKVALVLKNIEALIDH